ncbi:MAG: DNA polymerase domain-containing protein [Nanobdellota archaeon]
MWLMDAYRKDESIVLWLKGENHLRKEYPFKAFIYADPAAAPYLETFTAMKKQTYLREEIDVLKVPIPLSTFESSVRRIEQKTRYRVPLYNADITPEQMFLYQHDLRPCGKVILDEKPHPMKDESPVPLTTLDLALTGTEQIERISFNGTELTGTEKDILTRFARLFTKYDPDVIFMDYAFAKVPFLQERLAAHAIQCPLNRWDDYEMRYKGGKSFWSYGEVRYRDFALRLRGRFLVDKNSFVGTECDSEGIAEMAFLSGTLFQQTASRSCGAVFQTALIREMVRRDYLVPHKEKPIDKPITLLDILKCDRGGHYCDPLIGFHKDVAEIDFTSMFPWLIYNHNISADTILTDRKPKKQVPGVPITTTLAYKGLIPSVLKPFIDRRMHYKKNPAAKKRAKGLKWVLVSCYGYLRFREFKLGLPSSHMAICSLARETLLDVIELCREKGFEVVHGIVDSVYIKKKNITDEEVKELCREIECQTGIPMCFEGIFRWIVFLPSVVDENRALPATYYGTFRNGDIKNRGIEVRKRNTPLIVKHFQQHALRLMSACSTKKEIQSLAPALCQHLRRIVADLPQLKKEFLTTKVRIAKITYKHNIPQKIILEKLKKQGITVEPGQFVRFIYGHDSVCLPEEYKRPDTGHYKRLLIRALFTILQPFGFSRKKLVQLSAFERQTSLGEYGQSTAKRVPALKAGSI